MQDPLRHLWVRFARSVAMIILVLAAPSLAYALGPVASSGLCTVSATPLAFGKYDPLRHADAVTAGILSYRCSGTPKRLIIALTAGESNSFRLRRMGRGRKAVLYNLYLDAARTRVWGDGTGGSQTFIVYSPTSGSQVNIPVYGRLFGDQNDSAGNYHDDVSVVVTY